MDPATEQQYIRRAISGDKQAFNRLIDYHYSECLRKARAIVRDESFAQDLTQASMLQAYHCLDQLAHPSRFKYWLLGIVKNISYNYLKQQQRWVLSDDLPHVPKEDASEAVREVSHAVLSMVRTLKSPHRDIILAFYYDGLGLTEIADQQGVSLAAAKVRLHRARQQLKQRLVTHPDLFYYYQSSNQKKMKQVSIADIYLREVGGATVLLRTEDNQYLLSIVVGKFEAEAIAFGLQGLKTKRPWTHDLAASILTATTARLEQVCVHQLDHGVFFAYLAIRSGQQPTQVDARPSDAIALAVRLQAPILVAEEVLAEVGIPIPAAYRTTVPRGKGLNQFIRYFAQSKVCEITRPASDQRETKPNVRKDEPMHQRVLNLAFGDEQLPETRRHWEPHRYTTWKEAEEAPDQVKWLDLKHQDLTDFAERIKPFRQVQALELSAYQLTKLPPGVEQLEQLGWLNLSGNRLTHLPNTLKRLSHLRKLDLNDNAFEELPDVVGQLPALQELNLSENPALSLSEAFRVLQQAPALHCLVLKGHDLSSVPDEIAALPYLSTLVLESNPNLDLSQLLRKLSKLSTLNTLTLSRQRLTILPDEVLRIPSLVSLNLSDNPELDISALCQQLSRHENVKVLTLMRCNLTELPAELHQLSKLEIVELGENLIASEEQARIRKLLPNAIVVF